MPSTFLSRYVRDFFAFEIVPVCDGRAAVDKFGVLCQDFGVEPQRRPSQKSRGGFWPMRGGLAWWGI